jgi:ubiquinone/menaquinone biosynthesis C-methylase UbiE
MTTERYEQHKRGVFKKVRYMNVTRPFPYRSHTFDAVFSCHMLEHLRPDQAEFCLAECFRVLAREGVCRVVVPDLDILVSSYDSRRPEAFLAGIYEPVRHARGKNTHHWLYNANSLIALLRSIGFAEAYRCDYRKGRCPDINTLDNRPEGSLFVEGVK